MGGGGAGAGVEGETRLAEGEDELEEGLGGDRRGELAFLLGAGDRFDLVGEGGLGYSILYASSQLQTDYLFALVLAATVLGFSFFFIVMFFEWYFLHLWHESARTPEVE